ncbi:MAG: hypothetical protein Q8J84_03200 [Flavobacteriaceae bacterium]|nr:hypothetical protein [Flavobacteriaceae bacterium]
MRNDSKDLTLERNYLEKYRFLIKECEQVKNRIYPSFKKPIEIITVTELSNLYKSCISVGELN